MTLTNDELATPTPPRAESFNYRYSSELPIIVGDRKTKIALS